MMSISCYYGFWNHIYLTLLRHNAMPCELSPNIYFGHSDFMHHLSNNGRILLVHVRISEMKDILFLDVTPLNYSHKIFKNQYYLTSILHFDSSFFLCVFFVPLDVWLYIINAFWRTADYTFFFDHVGWSSQCMLLLQIRYHTWIIHPSSQAVSYFTCVAKFYHITFY